VKKSSSITTRVWISSRYPIFDCGINTAPSLFVKRNPFMDKDMKAFTSACLSEIRQTSPLVHNITNFVVMNPSANILLALGASPVMAHAREEVEEMAALSSALVLNIGTLDVPFVESMILAGKAANRKGIPVILDPVGSGATTFRTDTVKRLLTECRISVLRGNASEILSLVDSTVTTKGVESSLSVSDRIIGSIAELARKNNLVAAVSGEEDLITDGRRVFRVKNGHPLMTKVTGMGCGLSSVTGAFCAVRPDDMVRAAAAAFGFYGLCGELAAKANDKPGSFFTAFMDSLYQCATEEVTADVVIFESFL
jgi:hydroxyethylthiazole kinase